MDMEKSQLAFAYIRDSIYQWGHKCHLPSNLKFDMGFILYEYDYEINSMEYMLLLHCLQTSLLIHRQEPWKQQMMADFVYNRNILISTAH